MKKNQLNQGKLRRVMYVENKHGLIDGERARIGWVSFSKSGRSLYYRGRLLAVGQGIRGNFLDIETREEFWVSGIKKQGSNRHLAEGKFHVLIDEDAKAEYARIRASVSS